MAPEDNPADDQLPTREEWDRYEEDRAKNAPALMPTRTAAKDPPPVAFPIDLVEIEDRYALWHRTKYGPGVNVERTLAKFLEELGEFGKALNSHDPDKIAAEAADVTYLLMCLLMPFGRRLSVALAAKLAILFERFQNPAAGRD